MLLSIMLFISPETLAVVAGRAEDDGFSVKHLLVEDVGHPVLLPAVALEHAAHAAGAVAGVYVDEPYKL